MTQAHQTCPSRHTLATCWVTDYIQSSVHHFQNYPRSLSSLLVFPPTTIPPTMMPTLLF